MEGFQFKLPSNIDDLKELNAALEKIIDSSKPTVILFFSALYILYALPFPCSNCCLFSKQTFSIPGSALLNVLAGKLFGFVLGFPLICLLTTVGASCCYWMSSLLGNATLRRVFSNKINALEAKVLATRNTRCFKTLKIQSHHDNLFFYLLFLRLVPFTPNWLINIASPILNIPFKFFVFSVLFGIAFSYSLIRFW